MSIKDLYHVERISFSDCKEWILYKHYAHRIPSISYAFGLFDNDNILQGVCTFGRCAFPEMELICGDEYKDEVIQLNRLIVNQSEKNMTSFFISQCFKKITEHKIILSYSDINQNHHGYIYQATNFLYTGITNPGMETYTVSGGEGCIKDMTRRYFFKATTVYNQKWNILKITKGGCKHRYIYFIGTKKEKKEMRSALKYEVQPYPKGDNKNYDASYQPTIQGRLF